MPISRRADAGQTTLPGTPPGGGRGKRLMSRSSGKLGFSLAAFWELDPSVIGGRKGKALRLLQFVAFAGNNFYRNNDRYSSCWFSKWRFNLWK